MPELKNLNLAHNKINHLTRDVISNVPHIESLDVSYNHLKELQSVHFVTASNLHILKIDHNVISELEGALFDSIKRLKVLEFQNNNIKFFPNVSTDALRDLQVVSMDENPWKCSCLQQAKEMFSNDLHIPISMLTTSKCCTNSEMLSQPCIKNAVVEPKTTKRFKNSWEKILSGSVQ